MLALKRMMILGIVVFLIVWTALSSIGQVVGASEALPPTLVSPSNNAWVTENKPTFTWIFNDPDPNDGQSDFILQISNETNFVVQNITRKSSTQSYILATAEALDDGTYYWRVKTNDTNGFWSSWSNVWLVKIDTNRPKLVTVFPPRKWTELEVKELEIGGGEFVEINWTASDDLHFKQYELYILKAPPPIPPDMTPNATIADAYLTTYTIEGLDPDTTYHLSVIVVDQAGLSSEAATVSVTTKAPMNWLLMGGIAVAVEVAIAAILVIVKLFIKKE